MAANGGAPGELHVFLGAVPGAGKTYAMLAEGRRLAAAGVDVVVALAETHGRRELEEVAAGLEVIPRADIAYRGTSFGELDCDAVLARHPDVALVDELAHSNVPGSRRDKRWQDVAELLDAGIDVVTTLNVQHLAGLHDAVEQITGVEQREFVPDAVVLAASRVDFVDAPAHVVLQRLGRDAAGSGDPGFFDPGRMSALRGLAQTWLSEHNLGPAPRQRAPEAAAAAVVVALAPGAPAGQVVRRAAELAAVRHAPLVGVCVRDTSGIGAAVDRGSQDMERVLAGFGGRYAEVGGTDIALELARFAEREHAGVLVIGDTSHSLGRRLVYGSIARRTLRHIGPPVEVYVVPPVTSGHAAAPPAGERAVAREPVTLPARRRVLAWALAVAAPVALIAVLVPARSSIGLSGALVCALLTVVAAALAGGAGPALLATIVAVGAADFFFTVPYYSLRVTHGIDIIALIVFGVVGAVIGVLVHVLAARAWQTAHSQAAADQLARLAAGELIQPPVPPADLVAELRSVFDLDAVGIVSRSGDGWQVVAAAGGPLPSDPGAAQFAAEIAPGRVLVMNGAALTADTHLLRVFAGELLLARRRAQQQALEAAAGERGRLADRNQARLHPA